jgi:hypothetical protein
MSQDFQNPRFYAGFYLRIKNRTRFWGWGGPPAQAIEQSAEKSWAQLAAWLRMAHSSIQSGLPAQPQTPAASLPEQKPDMLRQ